MIVFLIILIALVLPRESKEFRIRVVAASDSRKTSGKICGRSRAPRRNKKKYNPNDIINEVQKYRFNGKNYQGLEGREFLIRITKVKFPAQRTRGKVISEADSRTLLVIIWRRKGEKLVEHSLS